MKTESVEHFKRPEFRAQWEAFDQRVGTPAKKVRVRVRTRQAPFVAIRYRRKPKP